MFAGDGSPLTVGDGWAGDAYSYTRHDGPDAPPHRRPVRRCRCRWGYLMARTFPVPAGTTWNDDTVRPWESFGDDVTVTILATEGPTSRADLAAVLQAGYDNYPNASITVYDYPPDLLKLPAAVIIPIDPWIMPSGMGGPRFTQPFRYSYDIALQWNRTLPDEALTWLEAAAVETFTILAGTRWKAIEVTAPTTVTVGGIDALECRIQVTGLHELGNIADTDAVPDTETI